jgi:hypothetical protein
MLGTRVISPIRLFTPRSCRAHTRDLARVECRGYQGERLVPAGLLASWLPKSPCLRGDQLLKATVAAERSPHRIGTHERH